MADDRADDGKLEAVAEILEKVFDEELGKPVPNVARLSIALGLCELPLTSKTQERVPGSELPEQLASLLADFDAWVAALHAQLAAKLPQPSARDKVKAIADAVWSKLTGSFSKDILHAQHVSIFARSLQRSGPAERRQLDCAGIVATTYSTCLALADVHGHVDLQGCRMQDLRERSVEVTTATASKRGLAVEPAAWAGWLYAGGNATVCTPHQAAAALVASVDPAITRGKKGKDSEGLQLLQRRLLARMLGRHPAALYPAALCVLADLLEVEEQDRLEAALQAGDVATLVAEALHPSEQGPVPLFERAAEQAASPPVEPQPEQPEQQQAGESGGPEAGADSAGPPPEEAAPAGLQQALPAEAAPAELAGPSHRPPGEGDWGGSGGPGPGWLWYPYSYCVGWYCRRAQFLAECAAALPEAASPFEAAALRALRSALRWGARGGDVLARYRFCPTTDDQLYTDIEGVLETLAEGLRRQAGRSAGKLADPTLLAPLLRLCDGLCIMFEGRSKPAGWVALLLRSAKLFSPEARAAAAELAGARSGPMRRARPLWAALAQQTLRPLFESADVGEPQDRAAKRRRGL